MDKRKEHTILGQFHFSVLSMRWAAQIQIQSLYLLMGIPQFAIIRLPPFHLFCSYFLLLQIDNSTLWRKNCSYVRKAEQVSQGIHGQVQGQQRKLIVISNWELVFYWVSLYFFPALLTHFTASSKSIVLQLLSYYSIPVHVAYSEVYNILLSSSACCICHSTKNLSPLKNNWFEEGVTVHPVIWSYGSKKTTEKDCCSGVSGRGSGEGGGQTCQTCGYFYYLSERKR